MIKKTLMLVLMLLALCLGAAAAEDDGILGKPFPDFTATDTEGNTLTLSGMLRDREAVLINIWATWCHPCEAEMGYLNTAYERFGDRVAFIVLSQNPEDTLDVIEAYRQAHGLAFPMGRDEGQSLYQYLGGTALPATVIVDRFGNAAFLRVGGFIGLGQVTRLIESFLGPDYTETSVLTAIPRDASTRALPVSAVTAAEPENESARALLFRIEGESEPMPAYVIYDDTARLRLTAAASDHPETMVCFDSRLSLFTELQELLDPQSGVYVYETPMPGAQEDSHFTDVMLLNGNGDILSELYLIAGDEYVEELAEEMRSLGYPVTWEYAGPASAQSAEPQAYTLHIVDQNEAAVPGVYVKFCTDETCVMQQSDENGTIRFVGTPDIYHVQLFKVPAGYGFDPDFELCTDAAYGEWVLRIRNGG